MSVLAIGGSVMMHETGSALADLGDGVACCCDEVQACCLPNGSCANLPPTECVAQGGVPQGEETMCLDVDCDGLCPTDCRSCPNVVTCTFSNLVIQKSANTLWHFVEVSALLEKTSRPGVCFWESKTPTLVNNVRILRLDDCSFINTDEPTYINWWLTCYNPAPPSPHVWSFWALASNLPFGNENISFAKFATTICPTGKYQLCPGTDWDGHQDCSSHGPTNPHHPECGFGPPTAEVSF